MDNVLLVLATLFFVFVVVKLNGYLRKKSIGKIVYSQSSIHNVIKDFIPKKIFDKPRLVSQSIKHTEKNMIKVVVIDNIAYWVKDNIFYTAETKNGVVIHESAIPVDIENMPKKELDKMLFILDNLRRGISDDSSSSGDK